jgi:opacity protein-like surface antigen
MLLSCSTELKAQDDAWHFTLTPYIWVPGFDGSMKIPQPPGNTGGRVGLGGSYLDNLNFVAMGSFEARKQRWSFLADTIYMDFSDPNRVAEFPGVAGGATIKAETGLKGFIFQSGGAYSLARKERMNFDVLAGVRYARLESKLALDITGTLPAFVGSRSTIESENFVDPIVGFKGQFRLSKKWYTPYYFDVGGFGLDSDLTVQAGAGIHYSFADWISIGFDYRYLHYDFGNEKMLLNDLTVSGPMLGVGFHF